MCFLSAGADGQGASPRRAENTAKKGIKPLQSAASLTSCQTIPVKALFCWRPEQENLGECKERKMYKERRSHRIDRVLLRSVKPGGEHQVEMGWNDRNGGF